MADRPVKRICCMIKAIEFQLEYSFGLKINATLSCRYVMIMD